MPADGRAPTRGGRAPAADARGHHAHWQDDPVTTVPISDDSIRLGQFLKLAGLADSGADARTLLEEGEVTVNGELEQRRGRQLHKGDVVEVADPRGSNVAEVG
jgi:ribosome-associated protein